MFPEFTIKLREPTEPRQILHLLDMDSYFGNDLHIKPIDEVVMANYMYGISNTNDFDEFCDTMHTAVYWMNDKYFNLCQIDKTSEALNLSTEIDKGVDIDDEIYRYDILFGAWLSFVMCDSAKYRNDFLAELSGMDETYFIEELYRFNTDLFMIETFTISWVKKIIDPCRAAAYGHYMLYLMAKVMAIMDKCEDDPIIMNKIMTDLYIFTQSVSRLCEMNHHKLSMN